MLTQPGLNNSRYTEHLPYTPMGMIEIQTRLDANVTQGWIVSVIVNAYAWHHFAWHLPKVDLWYANRRMKP